MNLKQIYFSVIIGILIMAPSFANAKPDRCPSVDVLKYRSLLFAARNGETYVAFQFDRYGTSSAWNFLLEVPDAKDANDAMIKGTKYLNQLSGTPELQPTGDGGWFCSYQIASKQAVYAYTIDEDDNLIKLIKHQH